MVYGDCDRIPNLIDWWNWHPGRKEESNLSAREKIKRLLDQEKVSYRLIAHTEAYSAIQVAESLHLPGSRVAKVVIVNAREEYGMVVLPAHLNLNFAQFAGAMGIHRVSLADERELKEIFTDCEVGAMSPFGNLYELPVYVDESLAEEPVIYFPAGSHREAVEMRYDDFERIVHPIVGRFGSPPLRPESGLKAGQKSRPVLRKGVIP